MNNQHNSPSMSALDDELNWFAFQYVSGELPEAQSEAFEEVLADDLAACEAVAAMSEMALQLNDAVTVEQSPVTRQSEFARPAQTSIRSWIAVGSTMIALGWLFMLLNSQDTNTQPNIGATQAEDAAGLIAGWAGNDQEEALTDEILFDLETFDLNDESTPDIPGWMIVAVSLENAEEAMGDIMHEPVEMKEN
jgi:hypothetical protein